MKSSTSVTVVVLTLLVASAFSATFEEDGRCGGMDQQLETQKLSKLYKRNLDFTCSRLSLGCKTEHFTEAYHFASLHPEPPGQLVQDWQSFRQEFQQLNPHKLDKYVYAQAKYYFDVPSPFSVQGLSPQCGYAVEDYWMFSGQVQSILQLNYYLNQFGAEDYQQFFMVPIYDSLTFQGLIGELNAVCPFTTQRINMDWWTKAYQYAVVQHGGLIPSSGVQDLLVNMNNFINVILEPGLGTANPLVSSVIARGYQMNITEYTALLSALGNAQTCMQNYYTYTAFVAPALTTPTTSEANWRAVRTPAYCDWEYSTLFNKLDKTKATTLFHQLKAELETLVPVLNSTMYQYYPDYLGYNQTTLHLNEALMLSLNLTFMGYQSTMCTAFNPYSNGTDWRAVAMANFQQIGDTMLALQTFNYLGRPVFLKIAPTSCVNPMLGSGYSDVRYGMDNKMSSASFVNLSPIQFRNSSFGLMLASNQNNNKYHAVSNNACEECWDRKLASAIYGMQSMMNIYNPFSLPGAYQYTQTHYSGMTDWFVYKHALNTTGVFNKYQKLNSQFYYARNFLLASVQALGYMTTPGQGWSSDVECAVFRQNNAWQPSASMAAAITSCATSRLAGPIGSNVAPRFVIHTELEAIAQRGRTLCGSKFNPQLFATLPALHGLTNFQTILDLSNDYVDAGCVSPVGQFGDCWRTVQPVRRSTGDAYLP